MDRHDHPETGGAIPANGREFVQPVAADSDPAFAAVDAAVDTPVDTPVDGAAEAGADGDIGLEPATEPEGGREPVRGSDHYRPL